MDRCDVLIVGGGPAGSSLAFGLRGSGLDVVVLDRRTFPRDKVCAGWVTPPVLDVLEIDPVDYRKERVLQPIHGFQVGRVGDDAACIDYGEMVSFGIRRCEFDDYLLRRSGARLRLGEPLGALRREGDGWRVGDALRARVLVGAGGHFCPVARHLGARPGPGEPTVVAREIEFEMTPEQQADCAARPELPELYFARDVRGYGWVVRKGDFLNVGIGRQDTRAFPRHVDEFLDWLEAQGRVPRGLPRGLRGHAYLLHDQAPRPLVGEGALLVGDAAGLAYNPSGEGIRPAVEAGLLAARALRASGGCLDARTRGAYERSVVQRLGRRHGRVRRGVTDLLPAAWRGPITGRALASHWFARHVVLDRWFLRRRDPALPVA